jgi:hypothetical protein
VSSAGSLPDYDDLRDAQLPVAKDLLQQWLSNPDDPITKTRVKQFKDQIKAAKKTPGAPAAASFDRGEMRRDVRLLLQEWKVMKRQQMHQRKQAMRDRRAARHAARKERKQARREMKRAKKDYWRTTAGMGAMPGAFPGHHHGPFGMHGRRLGGALLGQLASHAARGGGPVRAGGPSRCDTHGFGGRGFGGRARGRSRGRFPGAWPEDDVVDVQAHAVSQAKYKAAQDLEQRVAQKEVELGKLHEKMSQDLDREDSSRGGVSKQSLKYETQLHSIEVEMEALQKNVEKLRLEADEDYARELSEIERRLHG